MIIPDSVTKFGYNVFYGCKITTATMPTMVIPLIPKSNLTTVILTSGDSIDDGAFYGCYKLKSVTISNSVASIGDYAFAGCTNLTDIKFGDSVTNIGKWAFYNCKSLINITVPNSVTCIESCAFYDCSNLRSVAIGNSVTNIADWVFSGCNNLAEVTFTNPSGWWYASSSTETSGTEFLATDLSTPEVAAEFLRSTYITYYWFRTE